LFAKSAEGEEEERVKAYTKNERVGKCMKTKGGRRAVGG
jgi:hypothetical protein